jgi:hypothetical protein
MDTPGQPPIYDSPDKMQECIDEYFSYLSSGEKPTISGLCYYLGFESRQSFYDYEKRELFSYTIKRARLRIEIIYEQNLHGNSNAGSIFALKNFGWSDRQEIEHQSSTEKPFIFVVKPDK